MTDINIGQITEALNDKMDRDAHNVQSPSAVIIEKQDPTAANNYTWYRKYSDGWVEQGGKVSKNGDQQIISLLITMADTNYFVLSGILGIVGSNYVSFRQLDRTTTSVAIGYAGSDYNPSDIFWLVMGKSAN